MPHAFLGKGIVAPGKSIKKSERKKFLALGYPKEEAWRHKIEIEVVECLEKAVQPDTPSFPFTPESLGPDAVAAAARAEEMQWCPLPAHRRFTYYRRPTTREMQDECLLLTENDYHNDGGTDWADFVFEQDFLDRRARPAKDTLQRVADGQPTEKKDEDDEEDTDRDVSPKRKRTTARCETKRDYSARAKSRRLLPDREMEKALQGFKIGNLDQEASR